MSKLSIPAILALLALAFLARGVQARELRLGVDTSTLYDTNVFGRSVNEQDDVLFRISPKLTVEEAKGDLTWRVRLQPSYEYYVNESPLRGPEYDADGNLRWQISPRTSISATERFSRYSSTRSFNEIIDVAAGGSISPETQLVGFRDPFIVNSANMALTHSFTQRDQVSLSAFHSLFDFNREVLTDNSTLGAILGYERVLNARTRLGSRLRWSRQTILPFAGRNTGTDFVTLSGRVAHDFDPSFQISVEIGPTLVFPEDPADLPTSTVAPFLGSRRLVDVNTCPTVDDGTPFFDPSCKTLPPDGNFDVIEGNRDPITLAILDPNSLTPREQAVLNAMARSSVVVPIEGNQPGGAGVSLTFFADINLVKRWADEWKLTLGFRRRDSQGSSELRGSSISNEAYGRIDWRATRKLSFRLSADWTLRQQEQQFNRFAVTPGAPVGIDSRRCIAGGVFPTCFAGLFAGRLITFPASGTAAGARPRAVDFTSDQEYLVLGFRTSYRLSRRTELFSSLRYIRQDTSSDFTLDRNTERYTISVGVRYEFEPIHF